MIPSTLWYHSNGWNTLIQECLSTARFTSFHAESTDHDIASTVKVMAGKGCEPGKCTLLQRDSWSGRCWMVVSVDGTVWSALLSLNETRQRPAEQLWSNQPHTLLIATPVGPEQSPCVSMTTWSRRNWEIKFYYLFHCLFQNVMENTAHWYDLQVVSAVLKQYCVYVYECFRNRLF